MTHEVLQPAGWARPKGYANGIAAHGRTVFIAGQIGWDAQGRFVEKTLSGQVRQALENILCVLRCAGGGPEHVVRLTWFVLSREAYHQEIRTIGARYREVMGRNFPTMSVVQVVGLMEAEALVEIEATAVIPESMLPAAAG
ncbi:MAG: RidA family protein [Proteobacteria bacterium]|nr:RidA family protein [Pseudomonadota bacterium]